MKLFNSSLKKNKNVLSTYVNLGFYLIKLATSPMKLLLEHLLVAQDIDLNTEPGGPLREALYLAFNNIDTNSLDQEYDNWSHRKFLDLRKGNPDLEITEKQFIAATDLNKISDKLEIVKKKTAAPKTKKANLKAKSAPRAKTKKARLLKR